MTNAKVAVVTITGPDLTTISETVHGAQQVDVAAGHLHVVGSAGKTIAVYAPGFWQQAKLYDVIADE